MAQQIKCVLRIFPSLGSIIVKNPELVPFRRLMSLEKVSKRIGVADRLLPERLPERWFERGFDPGLRRRGKAAPLFKRHPRGLHLRRKAPPRQREGGPTHDGRSGKPAPQFASAAAAAAEAGRAARNRARRRERRGRRRRGLCTERAPLPPTLPQFSLQPPQLLAAARPAVHTFTSFPTPSFLACAFIIYTCLLRLVFPLLIPSYACLARPRICLPRNDWNILNQSGGRGEPGRGRVPRPQWEDGGDPRRVDAQLGRGDDQRPEGELI